MDELVVVRHGESEGNALELVAGRNPYPLTETGRAQAHGSARLIAAMGWRPTLVVTSPLRRCTETAEILVEDLETPAAQPDEAFLEIDCGRATGRPLAEIDRSFEESGGESIADLITRVGAGLDALPADERILLVTHGAVFKGVLAHLCDFDVHRYFLDLRYGTCLRLAWRGSVFSLTHLVHPEEWEARVG